jgi:hypothetical protein
MKFELNSAQCEMLKKWQLNIMEKYGSYGEFEYRFTPTGIGCIIKVYSVLSRETLNLSGEEYW